MIKLKNLLNEGSPGFTDREFGDPLPTLKGIMEKKDKDHGLSSDVVKFKQEYSTQQGKLKEKALKLRERKQVMEAVGMINQSIIKMLGELNELPVVDALENVTGEKVIGFRAPFFSIDTNNSWVLSFLRKHVKYDSSIFPVKSSLYGIPNAPRQIYHPSQENFLENDDDEELVEIPPLTNRILSCYNLPVAGGFYFRALPYFLIANGIKKFNHNNRPAMLYFHPKDLDKNMPKIKEYSWHYYYGKRNILSKFEKLLNDFEFTSARDFLGFKN